LYAKSKVVLNSLLQLVAASLKQVLKHTRGLTLFVRVTIKGDQKCKVSGIKCDLVLCLHDE